MRILRNIVLLAVAVAAGVFAYLEVSRRMAGAGDAPDPELIAAVERRDIETSLLLTGEVVPAFQFEVRPEVGGKVKQIHVSTGQFVRAGEPLVTIDDTDLLTERDAAQTEIAGAQLAADKNRGNYNRAKALFEEKLISKEVFDNLAADLAIAENTLEKARSRLRTVEDRLRKTRILAPADGTVLDILVNEGQVVVAAASVNSGTVLMSFADLSRLLINSHVNQMDAPSLRIGQEVEVNMAVGDPLKAKIEFVAPVATVKNNIKGFQVQAVLSGGEIPLKPGMSVSMTVPVAKAQAAVSVPVSGVFREQKQTVVYVRKAGGVERREVEVGISDLGFAEIRSGLQPGEEILLFRPPESREKS